MNKKLLIIVFIILSCAVYYANEQWFIYDIDDYAFSTVTQCVTHEDGSMSMTHDRPINSLADIVASQAACYQCYNGRFLLHGMVQWLCGTQPAWIVVVFNTLMWGVLIVMMILLCCRNMRLTWPRMLIPLGALWLLMPSSLQMFLGSVSGSADYLWTSAISMLFIYFFHRPKANRNDGYGTLSNVFLILLSLIAGAMQESYSIGIGAGLVVYLIINKLRLPVIEWAMIVTYLIGAALITLAPANFVRAEMLGHHLHIEALVAAVKTPVFSLMILALTISWFINRQAVKTLLRDNTVIVVALIVNFSFAVFIAYTGPWQLTSVAMCSTILLIQLLYRLLDAHHLALKTIALLLMAGTLYIATIQYHYRSHMWEIQNDMFVQAKASTDGIISMHKAFDFNRVYEQSLLAPLYRQYTRNFARALINDDQKCGNSMMSKFLTKCSKPGLVKALLPNTPQHIEQMFDTTTMQINGIKAVRCEDYIIVRNMEDDSIIATEPCQQYNYRDNKYNVYISSKLGF